MCYRSMTFFFCSSDFFSCVTTYKFVLQTSLGKGPRSVGEHAPMEVVSKVKVVGAGTFEADGVYRATRVVPNSTMLMAYTSNEGYRLVLIQSEKKGGARKFFLFF